MPKELELNENMTSDEIAAYAETVVKEVEAERMGDRKSDAEIVSDTAKPAENRAEENSGDDKSVEDSVRDEETGDGSDTPDWVDDKLKAEAAAYGIDESDLSDFASREELEKVFRLFDKKALEAGRKAMADGDDGKSRNEKGQFVKNEGAKEGGEDPKPAKKDGSRYEVSLSKDLYDDEIVNEFSRMRDYYEERLSALESQFVQVSAKSEEDRFDSLVDSLGHADLFGKTGKESQKELERRKDLHVAVKAQLIGLERLGRPAELNDQLISRVANMVFAEELGKKRLKQQTQKVTRQNQLRQGGSPTRPLPPKDNPRDEADRLYRELERSQ